MDTMDIPAAREWFGKVAAQTRERVALADARHQSALARGEEDEAASIARDLAKWVALRDRVEVALAAVASVEEAVETGDPEAISNARLHAIMLLVEVLRQPAANTVH